MLNFTTKIDVTTVMAAINADIYAVCVSVRGVAHVLVERLDCWLFRDSPEFYGMRQQFMCLIKRKPICCPVFSQSSGWSDNMRAAADSARSFGIRS